MIRIIKIISIVTLSILICFSAWTYADYSEDIDKYSYLSLSDLYDRKDDLIKTIDSNALLELALKKSIIKWVYNTATNYGYKVDKNLIQKQKELIQLAIDNKADFNGLIEKQFLSIDPNTLYVHKGFLFDNISSNNFMKLVLNSCLSYGDKQKVQEQQLELIKLALDKNADLNTLIEKGSIPFLSLEALYTLKDLLMNHTTPNNFLKLVLKNQIDTYINGELKIDEILGAQKTELMQLAIKKGAKMGQIINSIWINLHTLCFHKDLFIKELGATQFLNKIVSIYSNSKLEKEKQLELVRFAIDKDADVKNSEISTEALFSKNIELLELLIDNGLKCHDGIFDEMEENGLAHVFINPQLILDQKYKNLNAKESIEPKMPYIMHHIWLTHSSSPREIREEDIARAIKTKKVFTQGKAEWKHIVWTNDLALIPQSVIKLEEAGIQVKSIYEYKDDLKLFALIETLIEKKDWGKASDTLRYSLVEYLGGVYADINFVFNRDVTSEVHKYNFFTMTFGDIYIDNFFFGSSPKHPILEQILKLVERNLLTPPNYIRQIEDQSSTRITDLSTANPTYLAYYLKANQNGNVDVVYPLYEKDENFEMDRDSVRVNNSDSDVPDEIMDRMENIMKARYPMESSFYEYIQSREICSSEIYHIGEDGSNGGTWIKNPGD